jgi:hypothetical protein
MFECQVNGKRKIQEVLLTDHVTPPIDVFFVKSLANTTLATAASIGDTEIELTDATGFVDQDYIGLFSGEDRFYFGNQLGAPSGNTITLDTPLDFAFLVGDRVSRTTHNLAVDGSSTTQIFSVNGPGVATSDIKFDITRIILTMVGDNAPPPLVAFDASTFGNIDGGLTNGIVLRLVNGTYQNIFNAKTNQDLSNVCYDVRIDSGVRTGADGLSMRMTFAGQGKHGVAIRLRAGDTLEMLVQDDLTDLDEIHIMAQGHRAD